VNVISATRHVPLGEIAQFIRGVTFKPEDVLPIGTPGSIACLRTKNVQADLDLSDVWAIPERFAKSKDRYTRPGDIIVSTANSWNLVGKAAWVPELEWPTVAGGFVSLLRPDEATIFPRYLYRWITWDATQESLRKCARQTTNISNLSIPQAQELVVPLPTLEEQKRITAILDQADALRRLRRRALDRLKALGQSIFHEMFGGHRNHPRRAIAEFAAVKGGKRLPKGADYSTEPTEHPYIRVSDISALSIDSSNLKYLPHDVHRVIRRYTVQKGDVVITIAGTIGLTAAVPPTLEGANLTENAAKITPKAAGVFDSQFLAWALSEANAQDQILARTGQVTIGKLALFRIEQIEIALPEIDLQKKFAARIEALTSEVARLRHAASATDSLFNTLQSRAFRGEL